MGLPTQSFASAEEFLESYTPDRPGCLVTDVRMLGMSGIELQEELRFRGIELPVIVLTAFARTSLTVRAMRNGAVTMLDKPYNDDALWDAVRQALKQDADQRAVRDRQHALRQRFTTLTPSEREVLDLVVAGQPNKTIAKRLDMSVRTVENRRHDIFNKLQASSVAELVRLTVEFGRLETLS